MRFSIRDILWLTAVVALVATVYTDRIRVARWKRQWAEEKATVERETALAIAEMRAKVREVQAQNLLQEHRFNVQLKAERLRYAREIEQARTAAEELRVKQAAATAAAVELAAEGRE